METIGGGLRRKLHLQLLLLHYSIVCAICNKELNHDELSYS